MKLRGNMEMNKMISKEMQLPDFPEKENQFIEQKHRTTIAERRMITKKSSGHIDLKHFLLISKTFKTNVFQKRNLLKISRIVRGPRNLLVTTLLTLCICTSIITSPVNAAESLTGFLHSCSNEFEEVPLPNISNSTCFKCSCLNGFVKCERNCPPLHECFLLEYKSSDSCCKKCRGCMFKGKYYESGMEWADPQDPCKVFKCVSTVVTETTMKCFTQCDDNKLLPPAPGECCPKCPGCKINGQVVAEGQEVVASIDDRCLICQCTGNQLKCSKKSCPVLNCPLKYQEKHPNECCPRCKEHKQLMLLPDGCFYHEHMHMNKINFTPDRCTNCTCLNGTSVCQRATCPILECSPEYQEFVGCCPKCITSEVRSECIHKGITYQNNQIWKLGPCRSCRCISGNIRCSEMKCPEIKCRPNEEMKEFPNECCPRCVETAGTCTVFGDPHFKTFDGKFYSFQGSCKYLLTADCRNHSFSIRLTNDGRGTKKSSWAKTVTIKIKGARINLGQKMRVKVNGSRVEMPYSKGPILNLTRTPEAIFLKTELGVDVEWDGNNFVEVSVPSSYKHKLCGLCGNYNGISRDDLTSRDNNNHSDKDVWRFANSWKVGGPNACSRDRDKLATQPTCKKRKPSAYCKPLNESSVFGNCDNKLNPINYIQSCRMDVCECPNDICHCDSFAAYAHECKRLGINLPNWRAATNCPLGIWRQNATALKILQNHNPLYGPFNVRKKQRKIIIPPKGPFNLTVTKNPDSPPPPLN